MIEITILQLDNQYKLIQEKDNEKNIKVHNFISNTDMIDQETYIKLVYD